MSKGGIFRRAAQIIPGFVVRLFQWSLANLESAVTSTFGTVFLVSVPIYKSVPKQLRAAVFSPIPSQESATSKCCLRGLVSGEFKSLSCSLYSRRQYMHL